MNVDTRKTAHALGRLKEVVFHAGSVKAYEDVLEWARTQELAGLENGAALAAADVDEAEADFNRMCIGPYRLSVPPYESVWRSKGRVLNNRYSATVLYTINELGLSINRDCNELPDFFGHEIELIYFLLAVAEGNHAGGDEELARELDLIAEQFWAEHLGHWAFDFLDALHDNASHDFWKAWAQALKAVLTERFGEVELSPYLSGLESVVSMPTSLKEENK